MHPQFATLPATINVSSLCAQHRANTASILLDSGERHTLGDSYPSALHRDEEDEMTLAAASGLLVVPASNLLVAYR